MSAYLSQLAAVSLNLTETVQPRLAGLFEPPPATAWPPVVPDETQSPETEAPPLHRPYTAQAPYAHSPVMPPRDATDAPRMSTAEPLRDAGSRRQDHQRQRAENNASPLARTQPASIDGESLVQTETGHKPAVDTIIETIFIEPRPAAPQATLPARSNEILRPTPLPHRNETSSKETEAPLPGAIPGVIKATPLFDTAEIKSEIKHVPASLITPSLRPGETLRQAPLFDSQETARKKSEHPSPRAINSTPSVDASGKLIVAPRIQPYTPPRRDAAPNETLSPAAAVPVIHVTIGRIEIRATPAATGSSPRPPTAPAAMSLDDYLRRHNGATP